MNNETLAAWRYCFQRILTPCVVVIGILGNFVNVIVLTRRRMRCSTNIYLTALAVSDIVFLVFVFVLSLQHYPNWNSIKYELYWRTFGISHWFCDAAGYTSIYLTVSFTIERYIVVCHPLRGHIYIKNSTKNAKRVIAVVALLCFLTTITTAFEYQLEISSKYYDKLTGIYCGNDTTFNITQTASHNNSDLSIIPKEFLTSDNIGNYTFDGSIISNSDRLKLHDINRVDAGISAQIDNQTDEIGVMELQRIESDMNSFNLNDNNISGINGTQLCVNVLVENFVRTTESALGLSETYKKIFFSYTTIVFMILPLILLGTFNCFLVAAVRRSHNMRHAMTNTRITQSGTSSAQENKVTIILIAVVVLFLFCQTPTSVSLIYRSWIIPNEEPGNFGLALGNLMNFLLTIDAACNFLLYCALSDKYRKTVKSLLFAKKYHRQNTISSSRFSRYASRGVSKSFRGTEELRRLNEQPNSITRNPSLPLTAKRPSMVSSNAQRGSIVRVPRVSISSRPSLTPSDIMNFNNNSSRKNSNASIQLKISSIGTPIPTTSSGSNINNGNDRFLRPSESQTSLTRSQSLKLPSPIRHAPDCKSHPDNIILNSVNNEHESATKTTCTNEK